MALSECTGDQDEISGFVCLIGQMAFEVGTHTHTQDTHTYMHMHMHMHTCLQERGQAASHGRLREAGQTLL